MSVKITADHLGRSAAVYVRQSSPGQVVNHTESRRRQYDVADAARAAGFVDVLTIDEDLGRSGSGLEVRQGFQKLVAAVCAGTVGAVYCIEALRLARNGRDCTTSLTSVLWPGLWLSIPTGSMIHGCRTIACCSA